MSLQRVKKIYTILISLKNTNCILGSLTITMLIRLQETYLGYRASLKGWIKHTISMLSPVTTKNISDITLKTKIWPTASTKKRALRPFYQIFIMLKTSIHFMRIRHWLSITDYLFIESIKSSTSIIKAKCFISIFLALPLRCLKKTRLS